MEDATKPLACSGIMHGPSSKHTPTVPSGTPGEILASHSLPTSAQLSWTPVEQQSPNLQQSFLDVDCQHLLQSSDSANDHCRIDIEISEGEGVGESHDLQLKLVEHSPSQHQLAAPPSSGQPDTTHNQEFEEQKRKRDQQKAKREVKPAPCVRITAAVQQQLLDEIWGKHGKQEILSLKQPFLDIGHQQSSDNAVDQYRIGTKGEEVGEPIYYPLLSDPGPHPSHDSENQQYYQPNVDAQSQYREWPSDQPDTPHHHLTEAARNSTLSSTGSSSALHLAVGSRVQISTEPFRYGVIRWIGRIPPMQGLVAGIEMVSAECVCIGLYTISPLVQGGVRSVETKSRCVANLYVLYSGKYSKEKTFADQHYRK